MVKRILALDVGERRIGVAVSDLLGITAQGVETIFTEGLERDLKRVGELARRYETDQLLLGLPICWALVPALLAGLVCSLLFIAIGLLCGTVLNDKQVGGACGALLTNLTAWLSGIWFDISLLGDAFGSVARALPFYHAVEACRAALNGGAVWGHLAIVLAYAVGILAVAAWCFTRQMKQR